MLTSTTSTITYLPGRAGVRRGGPGQPQSREAAAGSSPAAGTPAQPHGDIARVGAERQEGKEGKAQGFPTFGLIQCPGSAARGQEWGKEMVVGSRAALAPGGAGVGAWEEGGACTKPHLSRVLPCKPGWFARLASPQRWGHVPMKQQPSLGRGTAEHFAKSPITKRLCYPRPNAPRKMQPQPLSPPTLPICPPCLSHKSRLGASLWGLPCLGRCRSLLECPPRPHGGPLLSPPPWLGQAELQQDSLL